jgi:5'-methylthioadenosine phosphorylase
MTNHDIRTAVIGGSGLYAMDEIRSLERIPMQTPFGKPSNDIVLGELRGKRVAFLPRHGEGHVIPPARIPYRANIFALKQLGVRNIIAVNAVGSLREDFAPGHVVVPDQLFDFTNLRGQRTFFDCSIVAHISVAYPFCEELRTILVDAVRAARGIAHSHGTLLIEDGPRFATRAESLIFKRWGCDLVGMTTIPEAFLAREAEMGYATMTHITDYDSWHAEEAPVTVDKVMATFQHNIGIAQRALANAIEALDEHAVYSCHFALDNTIMTDMTRVAQEEIERLYPLLKRVLNL